MLDSEGYTCDMAQEYKGEQEEAHATQASVDDHIIKACLKVGILQSRPVASENIRGDLVWFVQAGSKTSGHSTILIEEGIMGLY